MFGSDVVAADIAQEAEPESGACQAWTRKCSCSVIIVTSSFATRVVLPVVEAMRYADLFAM